MAGIALVVEDFVWLGFRLSLNTFRCRNYASFSILWLRISGRSVPFVARTVLDAYYFFVAWADFAV